MRQTREALLVPIYGLLVPFHVTTIKNITSTAEGDHAFVRIQFNVPGSAFGAAGFAPALKYPDLTFLREVRASLSRVLFARYGLKRASR